MNKQTDSIVFRGLVEADGYCRFYGAVAERFNRWNRLLLVIIAVLSLAAIIASLTEVHRLLAVGLSASVMVAALWLSYHDFSRRAGTAAGIASVCMDLINEWEELWFSDEDVTPRVRDLKQRITRITAQALMSHGFFDEHGKLDKLNRRSHKDAEAFWRATLQDGDH